MSRHRGRSTTAWQATASITHCLLWFDCSCVPLLLAPPPLLQDEQSSLQRLNDRLAHLRLRKGDLEKRIRELGRWGVNQQQRFALFAWVGRSASASYAGGKRLQSECLICTAWSNWAMWPVGKRRLRGGEITLACCVTHPRSSPIFSLPSALPPQPAGRCIREVSGARPQEAAGGAGGGKCGAQALWPHQPQGAGPVSESVVVLLCWGQLARGGHCMR